MADTRTIEIKHEDPELKAKFEKIFNDKEKFQELLALKDNDEIFAFLAKNGIEFDEAKKQQIIKDAALLTEKAKDVDTSELTEEQLQMVAGGFDWGAGILSGLMSAWVFSLAITAWPAIPVCTCALVGMGVGTLVGILAD
jgi:hypothetical protein